MKQLGGIDATFLYMETPETPMHVAGLTLYEPPADFSGSFFEHFKEFFLTRIHLAPIFEKKLARTVLELDHPLWVDAGELDLDYHLRRATLPAPGTWRQLEDLVGDLHSVPLDRTQPLWQFTVIEGLDDGNVAIYSKVHHAAIDGGAGMAIAAALYDMSPVPRKVKPPLPKKPVRKPSIEERAILGINDAVQNVIRQQLNVMQAIPQVLGTLTDLLAPPKSADGKPSGGSAIPAIPDVLAPKTPFNVTITSRRSYAARALSLTDAKTVSKATGTKINDVVMAVCAGALRPYLAARKALPKKPLVAFVPISLREPGNADASNQVFGMLCPIATQIEEPLERLKSIQKTDQRLEVAGWHGQGCVAQGFHPAWRANPFTRPGAALRPHRPCRPDAVDHQSDHFQRAGAALPALLRRRQNPGDVSGVDSRPRHRAQHHRAELPGQAQLRHHRRPPRRSRSAKARRPVRARAGRTEAGGDRAGGHAENSRERPARRLIVRRARFLHCKNKGMRNSADVA